jgi:DNA-binding response OmpR family regulator
MVRVLLNEPDAAIATAIRVGLEQHGFSVDSVADLEEMRARDFAHYAAVVIDVHRQRGGGLDLIRWIHRSQPDVLLRVIAITADDAEEILELLRTQEICDLVIKPVSLPEIVRAVQECLEKNPQFALH